jgi:hypothetical protein
MAAAAKAPGGGGNYDYLVKLLLIGDSGVGKSCLLLVCLCEKIYAFAYTARVYLYTDVLSCHASARTHTNTQRI